MFRYLLLCIAVLFPTFAFAQVESICPGGVSPRADVFACYNFDNLTNCITGQEATCLTDNGLLATDFNGLFNQMKITNEAGAAVGNGYIQIRAIHPGASGPSIQRNSQFIATDARHRFYIRFRNWLNYTQGPHSIGMFPGGGTNGCNLGGTFEARQDRIFGYVTRGYNTITGIGCGTAQIDIPDLNQNKTVTPALRNGRWFLVETLQKVDNACTNSAIWNGCNGIFQVKVAGITVLEYTNINYAGVSNAAKLSGFFIARMYFHPGVVQWLTGIFPFLDFDNEVIAQSSPTKTATVSSNQTGVSTVNVNSGHTIQTGDLLRLYNRAGTPAWVIDRVVTGTTLTSITFSGGAVDVNSGDVIDTIIPEIGPAAAPNAPGTADAASPYVGHVFRETFSTTVGNITQKPANDCSSAGGANGISRATVLGTSGYRSFVSSPVINEWGNICAAQGYTQNPNNNLQIDIPAATASIQTAGYEFPPLGDGGYATIPVKTIFHNKIFSCSNSYPNGYTFAGFKNQKGNVVGTLCGVSYLAGNLPVQQQTFYLGAAINPVTNTWAISARRGNASLTPVFANSGVPVTCGTKQQIEFRFYNDWTASLVVNGVTVMDRVAIPIAQVAGGTEFNYDYMVVPWIGPMEYCGPAALQENTDDLYIAGPSFLGCDGWGSGFSPNTCSSPVTPSALIGGRCARNKKGRPCA